MLKRSGYLLLFCSLPALCANANGPVTVVLEFDQPYSDLSLAEMEHEAAAVLKDTGLTFDWKLEDSLAPHSQFKSLLVFKMKGRCEMDAVPVVLDERGPLGLAFVSDGQVLSFGEIECDRVKQSVQRIVPRGKSAKEERLLREGPRPRCSARNGSYASWRHAPFQIR